MQVNAKPVIIYTNLQQNHKNSHLKIVHTNSEQPYLLQYKGTRRKKGVHLGTSHTPAQQQWQRSWNSACIYTNAVLL